MNINNKGVKILNKLAVILLTMQLHFNPNIQTDVNAMCGDEYYYENAIRKYH